MRTNLIMYTIFKKITSEKDYSEQLCLLHHLSVNLRKFIKNNVDLGQNIKIEKAPESP